MNPSELNAFGKQKSVSVYIQFCQWTGPPFLGKRLPRTHSNQEPFDGCIELSGGSGCSSTSSSRSSLHLLFSFTGCRQSRGQSRGLLDRPTDRRPPRAPRGRLGRRRAMGLLAAANLLLSSCYNLASVTTQTCSALGWSRLFLRMKKAQKWKNGLYLSLLAK